MNKKESKKKENKENKKESRKDHKGNGKAASSKKIWHKILSSNKDILKKSWSSDNPKKEYNTKINKLLKKFK